MRYDSDNVSVLSTLSAIAVAQNMKSLQSPYHVLHQNPHSRFRPVETLLDLVQERPASLFLVRNIRVGEVLPNPLIPQIHSNPILTARI